MINDELLKEKFIDHEVRIRLSEQNIIEVKGMIKDIHNILRWILGTTLVAVIIPIALRYFKLT